MDQGRHEVQLMRAELPSISVERAAALADSGRPQLGQLVAVKLKSRTAGIFRSLPGRTIARTWRSVEYQPCYKNRRSEACERGCTWVEPRLAATPHVWKLSPEAPALPDRFLGLHFLSVDPEFSRVSPLWRNRQGVNSTVSVAYSEGLDFHLHLSFQHLAAVSW